MSLGRLRFSFFRAAAVCPAACAPSAAAAASGLRARQVRCGWWADTQLWSSLQCETAGPLLKSQQRASSQQSGQQQSHLSGSFSPAAAGAPAPGPLLGVRPWPPACGWRGIRWLGGAGQSRALRRVGVARVRVGNQPGHSTGKPAGRRGGSGGGGRQGTPTARSSPVAGLAALVAAHGGGAGRPGARLRPRSCLHPSARCCRGGAADRCSLDGWAVRCAGPIAAGHGRV